MTTVRQTVTTVQTSHGPAPGLDNSLDALLEDLQSSVARGGGSSTSPAVNGLIAGSGGGSGTSTRAYREVTRTLERETNSPQVMHLTPANPTTVVAERSSSPMMQTIHSVTPGERRNMTYKTYYQTYQTASGEAKSATLPALPATSNTSDARLQQNLNELDNLLVDLRHAQRAGFDPPPPPSPIIPQGATTTTRTEVVTTRGGIDPGLMEPLSHSTPAPPVRQPTPTQQPQVTQRAVEYKQYRTERQYASGGGGGGSVGSVGSGGSGGPQQYTVHHYTSSSGGPPESPRLQPKRSSSAQRELVYTGEHVSRHRTRSPSPGMQRREYYETRDRYREKSPSNQRLQREVMYNETTATSSTSGRSSGRGHREPSPPTQHRRGPSPSPVPPPPPQGSEYRVTTVRTYNYGGSSGGRTSPLPSPTLQRPPYRSPSPVSMSRPPYQGGEEPVPARGRSPSPGPKPRVTHTVHTYTYDQGDQGPLTYRVQQPPPATVTYKYSSSQSSQRYPPGGPEEQQPLLPRPFPTPSPTPTGTQPPKRLDDLMASFSDSEHEGPPGGYYRTTTEKTVTSSASGPHSHGEPLPATNGSAVVPAPDAKLKEAAGPKDRTPTTNVAGPPVYYPPGVEMFAQKEEASMEMSGRARGKGKYKYEYESKEKSKSSQSSGGAVVPVCLPLCCAMPCVIM